MSDKQTDAPQKQVNWANDYGICIGRSFWYSTREKADDGAAGGRIAVIRREIVGKVVHYFTEEV
jgi:hypothetical protein